MPASLWRRLTHADGTERRAARGQPGATRWVPVTRGPPDSGRSFSTAQETRRRAVCGSAA